ncbi:MAG: hypothetical protein HY537_06415 [Deltaproteobacteria bacterium]|nr:hypothetical protein [Deltaproteobacteria bacterium]
MMMEEEMKKMSTGTGNSKTGIVGAFALGFGLGMTAAKWWPVIREKAGPLGKELVAKGLDVWDKTKDTFWEKSEKFADVIAEIKDEQEKTAKDKK